MQARNSAFVALCLLAGLILSASAVSATHATNWTLSPEWSAPNVSTTYNATVFNYGPSAIREVFVFRNPYYTNDSYNSTYGPAGLQCPLIPLPGWTGVYLPHQYDTLNNMTTGACYFYSSNPTYFIKANTSATFQFNATTPSSAQCLPLKWLFRTIDQVQFNQGYGTWIENQSQTVIDNTPPTFTKTVTGPQLLNNVTGTSCSPDGKGFNGTCWITNDTTIKVNVTDPISQACEVSVPSGINYCDVNVTIDGQPAPQYSFRVDGNGAKSVVFNETFNENSQHNLSFTCYDRAGNVLKDSELFRVDIAHPNTSISFSQPKKINSTATWIDNVTTTSLTAVDPDPSGKTCNIGVDTTYVRTFPVNASYCLDSNTSALAEPWHTFSQSFESNSVGWYDYAGANLTIAPPGYHGISAPDGSRFALLSLGDLVTGGAYNGFHQSVFTRFGGYQSPFPAGGYVTSVDVYLNTSWSNGSDKRLDWSSETKKPNGDYGRDFIIHIDTNTTGPGQFLVSSSNNAPGWAAGAADRKVIDQSGWYRLTTTFMNNSGNLRVVYEVERLSDNSTIYHHVENTSDVIGVDVGGNGYGWFAVNDFANLPIDNSQLSAPSAVAWQTYTGPFHVFPPGCIAFEYYSVDRLGNTEPVQHTFAFHDTQPPKQYKAVGQPNVPMLCNLNNTDKVLRIDNSQFSTGTKGDYFVDMNRTFSCDGMLLNASLMTEDNSKITASGFEVMLRGTTEPYGIVGVNSADNGGQPFFKPWTGSGFGAAGPLLPGMTVTGSSGGTHFTVFVPVKYLTDYQQTVGWAANLEVTAPGVLSSSSSQKNFPADWNRWTAINVHNDSVGNYYVTTNTPVTLSCVDPGQYPSGDSTIHYRILRNNSGVWQTVTPWTSLGGTQVNETDTIQFGETSLHELQWYCTDAVSKTSANDTEYFKVDDEAPVITKTIEGPHTGPACPAGTNETPANGNAMADCVIEGNNVTHVFVNATDYKAGDAADHYVGGVTCNYSVTFDNESLMSGSFLGKDGLNLSFNQDSHHVLSVNCSDRLGNTAHDLESFFVDQTPPTTTKYYREPFVSKTVDLGNGPLEYHWMTTHTPVQLYAKDNVGTSYPNQKAGVANISYSIERVNLSNADCNAWCEPPEGYAPNYTTVAGSNVTFYAKQDSCHVIEFYATDKLGNKEEPTTQCVFVDDQAPSFNKTVGKPSIFVGQGGDNSSNGTLVCHDVNATHGNVTGALDLSGVGTKVYQVNFSENCPSGLGVGIAYDGKNLWYSCYDSSPDLYKANPLTGQVVASYDITGGLGAIAYDSGRNVIWAGSASGQNQTPGQVYKIQLNGNESVVSTTKAFVAQNFYSDIMDGLTFDGKTDTIYLSQDANYEIQHYTLNGTLLGTFPAAGPQTNSGLAIGGQLLYEGMDGASHVYVVNKTNTSQNVFNFSTGGFRDEGLECDPNTFAAQNDSVMWSMEAYDLNGFGATNQRTAIAFKVPAGTCGYGGQSAQVCEVVNATGPGTGVDWIVNQSTPVTFSCKDPQPHPVGNEKISFQVLYQGNSRGSGVNESLTQNYCANLSEQGWVIDNTTGACTYKVPGGGNATITFQQDSIHELKAWCSDELGNRKPADIEYFAVDSVPPNTNLTVSKPKYLVDNETPVLYADNATRFTLTAADPQPHPAGLNSTYYYWTRVDDSYCWGGHTPHPVGEGDVQPNQSNFTQYTAPFGIPVESCHAIFYYSVDNLGNREHTQVSYVFMDHQPPRINVTYGQPHVVENGSDYINSSSLISLATWDPQPHPSGVNWSRYRYARVNDSYCYGTNEGNESLSTANWTSWTNFTTSASFRIPEQSCHAIQVYSIDHVHKHNSTTRFVFVDDSPPTMNKTVGMPSTLTSSSYVWTFYPNVTGTCNTAGGIDCWNVTTMTPINLKCTDVQPHPVGEAQVHFQVGLDGNDSTAAYCQTYNGTMEPNGYCLVNGTHVSQFKFTELSEHKLSFYCSDGLGNTNPKVDTEMFKVHKRAFIIHLNKKWNLISVPFRLLNDQMTSVFNQTNKVISVWGYNGSAWHVYTPDGVNNDDLHAMLPGYGYWVLASGPANLSIGGDLFSPALTPPEVAVVPGWNLLGYYGTLGYNDSSGNTTSAKGYFGPNTTFGDTASCVLGSLPASIFDTSFAGVYSYWEPYNPNQWNTHHAGVPGLLSSDRMDPGAGYWVFSTANTDRLYAPNQLCNGGGLS